jgi:hypothetical protein
VTPYLATLGILALATFALFVLDAAYRRRERAFDRREQAWEAERRQLLNRLMYAQGKPWEGPPEEPSQYPLEEISHVIDPLLEALP